MQEIHIQMCLDLKFAEGLQTASGCLITLEYKCVLFVYNNRRY